MESHILEGGNEDAQKEEFLQRLGAANVVALLILALLYLRANVDSARLPGLVSQGQANCVANFPGTRNTTCLDHIYLKETPLTRVVDSVDQLAIHQLAIFADKEPLFDAITALSDLKGKRVEGTAATRFAFDKQPNPVAAARVFRQPAPGQSEFIFTVPTTDKPVMFISVAFAEVGAPPDKIIFRVGARLADGSARVLSETTYDPTVDPNGTAIRVPLDQFKGQAIVIILQTRGLNGGTVANAAWIDPSVAVLH